MSAGRKNNLNTNKNYNTPPFIVEKINEFFKEKGIQLDPCSNEFSMIKAYVNIILPVDGLKENWCDCYYKGVNIFVNPPYGRSDNKTSIKNWVEKGIEANKLYNSEIIYLIPVATNTQHFKLIYENGCGLCFLKNTRLKFWLNGDELQKGCPVSCCLAYIGNSYDKFEKVFSNLGKCFKI